MVVLLEWVVWLFPCCHTEDEETENEGQRDSVASEQHEQAGVYAGVQTKGEEDHQQDEESNHTCEYVLPVEDESHCKINNINKILQQMYCTWSSFTDLVL